MSYVRMTNITRVACPQVLEGHRPLWCDRPRAVRDGGLAAGGREAGVLEAGVEAHWWVIQDGQLVVSAAPLQSDIHRCHLDSGPMKSLHFKITFDVRRLRVERIVGWHNFLKRRMSITYYRNTFTEYVYQWACEVRWGRWWWGCLTSPDTRMWLAPAPACAAHCDPRERPQTPPRGAGPGSHPGAGGGRTREWWHPWPGWGAQASVGNWWKKAEIYTELRLRRCWGIILMNVCLWWKVSSLCVLIMSLVKPALFHEIGKTTLSHHRVNGGKFCKINKTFWKNKNILSFINVLVLCMFHFSEGQKIGCFSNSCILRDLDWANPKF